MGNDARVTVQAQGQLGQVVGADREAVEVFQELFGEDGVGRQFAHHDHAQAVVAAGQAVFGEQVHDLAGFAQGAYERHHDLDVGQAHLVAHTLKCTALELEAVTERFADVTRSTAEAQHRVFFFRLVQLAADEVGVLVGLEVRQAHDDLFRVEGRRQGADAFYQLLDVEANRVVVAGDALVDAFFQVGRQARIVQQRLGVHADHAVDDELQACQPDTGVGQLGEVEGAVRVADVHHDLERQFRHGIDRVLLDVEAQLAFEDKAGIAFGTGNGHALAVFQYLGSVAATDNRRDTQLTGDDRCVAGTATAVGDDGTGALHHRFPVRVGHVGDQHVAWLDLVHFRYVVDDANLAGADTLANGTAFDQHGAFLFEQVAFHDVGAGTALHRLRAGLDDVQLAIVTVLGPLDVHRALVVLLDDHGLLGQLADLGIGQAEASTLGAVDFDGLDRTAGLGFVAIDHLDRLAAQVTAQDGRAAGLEGVLVHVEFVRVDCTLYDGFAQAIGASDEHHVAEARLGVEGEHDAGGAGFGANHALHTGRQGNQLVIEALVHAVGDGAVIEQRSEHFLGRADHVIDAADVEEGFLLAGERGVWQVFSGSRGTDSNGHVVVAGGHFCEGRTDFRIQAWREFGFHDPLANLRAGLGQGIDVVNVQRVERGVNAVVQPALLEKVTVRLSRSGKAARHRHAGTGEVTDHLAQGCVLAPHMLHIMDAELIEGNYVLYQGDLSTNCVGKAQKAPACLL